MTVGDMMRRMSGAELDLWLGFYALEHEENAGPQPPPPFARKRRTIGG